uniref:Spermatogenesis- and oogenesis-specific basic helix-loop-helix-containing protein 2 n=1 Tax=Nannospalax galili TaxID=1026970 RepID=A0A8C6RJX2_NANGA
KLGLPPVGDATKCFLAGAVQNFFANTAQVTITISDVKKVAALLAHNFFDMIFLKVTSTLSKEELEAIESIRFFKKKNRHLLFVFIIPEKLKGCVSEYEADVSFTEPLTMEKMNIVVKYWKIYFMNAGKNESTGRPAERELFLQSSSEELLRCLSTDLFACSESPKNDVGLELKAPFADSEKSKKVSGHHSSKEKLRRERIKCCCEQLRSLLPYTKGRKSDMASVLEATVDYVKYVRGKITPAVLGQTNKKFSKRQVSFELCFPGTAVAQREDGVLTGNYSPVTGIQVLTNQCLNVYSAPAAGGTLEEAVTGQSSSISESPNDDLYKTQIPSTALSLNSFHAVRYCSGVVPSYDAASIENQNISFHLPSSVPKVSQFLPQHFNSMLCQTCTTNPNCLYTPGQLAHKHAADSQASTSSFLHGFQESDSGHQAARQALLPAEPSPRPQEKNYF